MHEGFAEHLAALLPPNEADGRNPGVALIAAGEDAERVHVPHVAADEPADLGPRHDLAGGVEGAGGELECAADRDFAAPWRHFDARDRRRRGGGSRLLQC